MLSDDYEQEEQAENTDRFISKVRKYLDLDELTPAVLNGQHSAQCRKTYLSCLSSSGGVCSSEVPAPAPMCQRQYIADILERPEYQDKEAL